MSFVATDVSAAQARWAAAVAPDRLSVRELADRLRAELALGRLVATFEPVAHVPSGLVFGAVARASWESPDLRIDPRQLRVVARSAGAESMLDDGITQVTLEAMAAWGDAFEGAVAPRVAIEHSAASLAVPGFAERLATRVQAHGVDPEQVQITLESTAVDPGRPEVTDALLGLRAHGLKIGMQGVGAVSSTFSALRDVHVDSFRLSSTFVAGIGGDETKDTVVRGLCHLAAALGMVMVASGVASEQQFEALAEINRDDVSLMAHGPWVGPPLEPDAFVRRVHDSFAGLAPS